MPGSWLVLPTRQVRLEGHGAEGHSVDLKRGEAFCYNHLHVLDHILTPDLAVGSGPDAVNKLLSPVFKNIRKHHLHGTSDPWRGLALLPFFPLLCRHSHLA